MIPYINRTADISLSSEIDAKDVNVREVIDEFRGQCDDFSSTFEAFVLMAPGRFRVTCKSARKLEIVENTGYFVRGLPVHFHPVSTCKWVNISRLSYGVPDVALSEALSPYGNIRLHKSEQYASVYTGVRNVLMEIKADIPMRLRISGHWCNVFYKGQKRLCFTCQQEGHFSNKCPQKNDLPHTSRDAGETTCDTICASGKLTDMQQDRVAFPESPHREVDVPVKTDNAGASQVGAPTLSPEQPSSLQTDLLCPLEPVTFPLPLGQDLCTPADPGLPLDQPPRSSPSGILSRRSSRCLRTARPVQDHSRPALPDEEDSRTISPRREKSRSPLRKDASPCPSTSSAGSDSEDPASETAASPLILHPDNHSPPESANDISDPLLPPSPQPFSSPEAITTSDESLCATTSHDTIDHPPLVEDGL